MECKVPGAQKASSLGPCGLCAVATGTGSPHPPHLPAPPPVPLGSHHQHPLSVSAFAGSGSFPKWDNLEVQGFNFQPMGDRSQWINVSFPDSVG